MRGGGFSLKVVTYQAFKNCWVSQRFWHVLHFREANAYRSMSVIDNLPAIVISFTLEGETVVIQQCHLGALKVLGVGAEALLLEPALLFKQVKNLDLGQKIRAALRDKTSFNSELHLCNFLGEDYWLQCSFNPTGDVDGCACIIDISDSHAEAEKSRESARFFMHMQDQLQDLFYYKDSNSRFQGGNRAFYEYHGETSMDALLGKSDLDSKRLKEEVKQKLFIAEQQMMATGIPIRKREHNQTLSGDDRYYESIKTPLQNEQGETMGMVGITRDVTKQVMAEQAREQAKAEAEQAAKAKSAFLAAMSHEIRTPMNGVIGCASLLADTGLNEAQLQLVSTIQNSGDALLVLINDILDYSKIEAGKVELDYSHFDLRALVEDCVELFCKNAAEKNIELNSFVHASVPDVLNGDSTRIRQVLCNLLSNAIKFTDSGEVFVDVSLASTDHQNNLCGLLVKVRDTGIGISEKNRSKLFDAFTQADSSITRKYGGTGLGLVISKKLVECMGGDIRFESEEGVGSTFYVTMALTFSPSEQEKFKSQSIQDLKGLKILIVDDNETNRIVLEKSCIQWQAEPISVDGADQALAHLNSGNKIDLVLLDFCMPQTNGCELASVIRKMPNRADISMILLSSINAQRNEIYSVDSYLIKPVRHQVLFNEIKRVLGEGACAHVPAPSLVAIKPCKILVAEDHSVNQVVINMMLKKLGYSNLTLVENGVQAVEKTKQEDFDFILMDVQMPELDGFQATQLIREQLRGRSQPKIIALTAAAMESDHKRALEVGMDDFVTKPFTLETLKSVLLGDITQDE